MSVCVSGHVGTSQVYVTWRHRLHSLYLCGQGVIYCVLSCTVCLLVLPVNFRNILLDMTISEVLGMVQEIIPRITSSRKRGLFFTLIPSYPFENLKFICTCSSEFCIT